MKKTDNQEKTYIRMTQAKIPGLVMSLAVPMIISNLITSIYNMADTFFVGRLEEGATSATGAIGVTFGIQLIIQAIGYGLGNGTGNNVSRLLGAKENEKAEEYASTGILTAIGIGILFAFVCFIFRNQVVWILGASESIAPYAVSYLLYILLGAPFMIGSFCLMALLRGQGKAWAAMIGLVAGSVLNVGLDPLLIYTMNMGISGAALATCLSQMVSFFILLVMNGERKGNIGLKLSRLKPRRSTYKDILNLGVPSIFRQGVSSVSSIVLNHAALPYGDAAIAAMSIVARVTLAVYGVMVGFSNGYIPVCNYNYGAKKYRRVRKAYLFSLLIITIWLIGTALTIFVFAKPLITLFREDEEVIRKGVLALQLQCISMPFQGWYLLCNISLQGLGYGFRSTMVAVMRQGTIFVPVVFLLTALFGLTGVQTAQPVSDFLSSIIVIPMGLKLLKSLDIDDDTEHIKI